jgi:Xaa-Pro aminopeptidase
MLRRRLAHLLVSQDTDVVIEGYPRSGNTFAEVAFIHAQNNSNLKMATHLHLPIQVTLAVREHKPCLILIRNPLDAIASLLVYAQGRYPIRLAIKEYIAFYELVRKHRDQLIVATFDEVLENFGQAIKRLNAHYGCKFKLFDPTEENKQACFRQIEQRSTDKYGQSATHALRAAKPTKERNQHKQAMLSRLAENQYAADLEKAQSIYRMLSETSHA